jgi:two-component system, cell cycle sensor histidine kinase and response regulator CckA
MADTKRVLVVEDEDVVRTLLERMLTTLRYEVEPVSNGKEALQLIRGGAGFDLLLTDMVLPGISGLELAAEVAELAPATKILFMSGYPDDGTGSPNYLTKPFTADELAERVRNALV